MSTSVKFWQPTRSPSHFSVVIFKNAHEFIKIRVYNVVKMGHYVSDYVKICHYVCVGLGLKVSLGWNSCSKQIWLCVQQLFVKRCKNTFSTITKVTCPIILKTLSCLFFQLRHYHSHSHLSTKEIIFYRFLFIIFFLWWLFVWGLLPLFKEKYTYDN